MTTTTVLVLVLGVYYAIVLTIGFWKFRSLTKSAYVSAPNSTGFFILLLSLLGTIVGGGMFLGISQIGYNGGLTAFALGVAYLVGSVLLGLLAPSLRKICIERKVITLVGLFESLYPSSKNFSVSSLFIWTSFSVFLLMLTIQFLSIATFFKFYANINFDVAIMAGAGVVAVISTFVATAFGGFTRDLWADVAQMTFITFGVAAIIITETFDSGLRLHLATLPPEFFTVGNNGVVFFVGSLFFVAPTFLVRFDLWQRIVTAKTDAVAKNAFIFSGLVAFFFFAFFGLIGMYGRALGLQNEEFVALEVIQQKMTGVSYSLVITAFFAAVMSTADTFLGVTSLALAKGTIYRSEMSIEKNIDDVGFVPKLRRITLVVGAGSLLMAYVMRDIVDAFAMAFGLLMVFLPALIGGLLSDEPKESAAKWSSVSGLVAVFVFGFLVNYKTAFLPGCLVATSSYLFILWLLKRRQVKSGAELN